MRAPVLGWLCSLDPLWLAIGWLQVVFPNRWPSKYLAITSWSVLVKVVTLQHDSYALFGDADMGWIEAHPHLFASCTTTCSIVGPKPLSCTLRVTVLLSPCRTSTPQRKTRRCVWSTMSGSLSRTRSWALMT